MDAFWNGFEKRAYDYDYEARVLKKELEESAQKKPLSKLKGGLVGAGLGGVTGALFGAADRAVPGAFAGGAAGMAVGGLAGVLRAIAQKRGIEEAKRVLAMPPKEQKEYLRYLARTGEDEELMLRTI